MNLIKPKKLKSGDTIAIIAPAGRVNINNINKSINYFESRGYKVKPGLNIAKQYDYMAGTDEERLDDLHSAFVDSDVDAIICARGGYGALRLLNKIDYNLIKNNPKIFCGYSDITAISAMILKNTGLITFSGPMAQSDFSEEIIDEFTQDEFWKVLKNDNITITPAKNSMSLNNKDTNGLLFGGNLSTIVSLCGTDFIPEEKFIFFSEDINEPVYKIDKYFHQLLNIKKFRKNLAAILLGDFTGIDNAAWLDNLFIDLAKEINVPILSGYPVSHSKTKATIPYGGRAVLEDSVLRISY